MPPKKGQNTKPLSQITVLPSSVDQERADRERWWYKPDYIINDLNLNSAITHPVRGGCGGVMSIGLWYEA
jgi:nitrate reductase (NAD(P)H)